MWSGVSVEHMVLIYKLPCFRPQSLAIVAVRTLQTPPFQLKSIILFVPLVCLVFFLIARLKEAMLWCEQNVEVCS